MNINYATLKSFKKSIRLLYSDKESILKIVKYLNNKYLTFC